MKFINEFAEGEHVVGIYLCAQKQILKTKTGKEYLSLVLQDKTSSVNAKIWDPDERYIKNFNQGDFIKVEGIIRIFNDNFQFNIEKLRVSLEGEYDLQDYIPTTKKDIEVLKKELFDFIASVKNIFLNELLNIIFADKDILKKFITHSAGKSMHHSYVGGLIEHTISVTEICDYMSGRSKLVDRNILITTAILHDIGKVYELSDFPANDYTESGELLGHIVIGADLISKKITLIKNFPDDLRTNIIHCILSHHGEYEFGSPKLPKTIEALILHFADNLDAKTKMFEESIESDTSTGNFTSYNRVLLRRLLKPAKLK